MAVAPDRIERTQIVVEPRDGVPRDGGPAGRAAPRTPAGPTPPTEKISSVRADHVSERRVDGVEIKVIDPVAVPVFHRRRNRATLQEPEARSLERPRLDVRHSALRARGPRTTRQTSHDPEAPSRATREFSE